jgi:hypothetical protein
MQCLCCERKTREEKERIVAEMVFQVRLEKKHLQNLQVLDLLFDRA